jgi:hypothetical protein
MNRGLVSTALMQYIHIVPKVKFKIKLSIIKPKISSVKAVFSMERLIRTPKELEKKFIQSYIRSNTFFPQTRFYFILIICGKLVPEDIEEFNQFDSLSVNDAAMKALERLSQKQHRQRSVAKMPDLIDIEKDIMKTVAATRDFLHNNQIKSTTNPEKIRAWACECRQLSAWIDDSSLSQEYLDFLSPAQCRADANIVRMASPLTIAMQSAPRLSILESLWPEIDKQVWVVR